ncbi:MAG: hypothetical protein LBR65_01940 [Culturomica sp.]|jgi:hypothetical protein|nr:hypothetical protein [Culturomica sp.]
MKPLKKYIQLLLLLLLSNGVFWACEDSTTNPALPVYVSFGTPQLNVTENMTPVRIPVSLSTPSTRDVAVELAVKSEDGAVEGVHYRFYAKRITIPAGSTAGYFDVLLTEGSEAFYDRIFTVELVDALHAGIVQSAEICRIVIQSSIAFPTIGFRNSLMSVTEDEGFLQIPVELSRPHTEDIRFTVGVLPKWDAVEGEHYILPETEYVIPAGEVAGMVLVEIVDDDVVNPNRVFEIGLLSSAFSQISEVFGGCKTTILNEDRIVQLSFGSRDTSAYKSDTETLKVPLRLNVVQKTPVSVVIGVRDGEAVEGEHFSVAATEFTFLPGETLKEVEIEMIDNDRIDIDRSFELYIRQITGSAEKTKDSLCTVTVVNDRFDFRQLYDDMMGEWTMTQTDAEGRSPKTATIIISGGDTPEEEDANYLKKFICRTTGSYYNTPIKYTLNFDVNTGAITVQLLETVSSRVYQNVLYNIKFEYSSSNQTQTLPTTASKDFRTITWQPGAVLNAIFYYADTDVRASLRDYSIRDVVLTKNK